MPPRRPRRRFVGLMRLVLPGIAIGLVVLVVAWPKIFGEVAGMIAPSGLFDGISIIEPMRMRQPRYVGADSEGGRPYVVEADEAEIDPKAPDRIALTQMRARMESPDGGLTRLESADALYQRDIEQATIRLDERRAAGEQPIHGVGPRGTIDADGFAIAEGGDVIRFHGNVRVVLTQDRPQGAAP
jgi:lipopolysaccharide export system protein LptC